MSSHSHNVWFPVAEDGEPVERNPDDGCGGALFKLNYIREFDKNAPVTPPLKDEMVRFIDHDVPGSAPPSYGTICLRDTSDAAVSLVGRDPVPENTPPPPPSLLDLLIMIPWP